jgi:hypothetical protein
MGHGPLPWAMAMGHGPWPKAMKTFRGEPCEQSRQPRQNRRHHIDTEIDIGIAIDVDLDVGVNVEVDIGGQVIDTQHGDWNAIWWNLTTPESKVGGLEECFMGNINVEGGEIDRFFWYPLNFWFCRNVGSAVPLIALQYNEMKLKINWGSVSTVSPKAIVLVDYICLDTDERRRFAQISHEYLIEQVQRIHGPADTDNINLNFDHPVKELIWVNDMTAPASSTGATWKFGAMKDPVRYFVGDQLKCKIQFNGEDRISYRPSRYFKVIQPLKYHTRVPGEWGPVKQRLEVIGDGQPVASGDPKIVIAIVVENGGHGGSPAGPIAKKVFDAYLTENN